jgi:glycosyltransferase involved in cell wall biosynthesis
MASRLSDERLGAYVDGPYALADTADGRRVAPDPADFPFTSFVSEVGRSFASTVLFGRLAEERAAGRDTLPAHVELAPLPFYEDLRSFGQVARAAIGTVRGFWRGLARVDVVWVFGPHPFSFLLVALALARRRRVVLGVRQDTVAYFRSRMHGGRGGAVLLLAARVLDAGFRALARVLPATVVGPEIEQRYGGPRRSLVPLTISLVRRADVAETPPVRDWSGDLSLFTVGRIDREKNPLLLVELMAALERERPGRFRLAWAGTGPLEDDVRRRAAELGADGRIELLGFVPFGPAIIDRYRAAHMFVHVSLTEGVPAVIMEALASGTPVVATAVGGVPAALDGGEAGLLVPPADLDALLAAVLRMADDAELRERAVSHGLRAAAGNSLEPQAARAAALLAGD